MFYLKIYDSTYIIYYFKNLKVFLFDYTYFLLKHAYH